MTHRLPEFQAGARTVSQPTAPGQSLCRWWRHYMLSVCVFDRRP